LLGNSYGSGYAVVSVYKDLNGTIGHQTPLFLFFPFFNKDKELANQNSTTRPIFNPIYPAKTENESFLFLPLSIEIRFQKFVISSFTNAGWSKKKFSMFFNHVVLHPTSICFLLKQTETTSGADQKWLKTVRRT